MVVNISRVEAETVLLEAYKAKCLVTDDICKKIQAVIVGNHKTYKYVLLTGLLAKATNNKVNALALQAGAPLEGAYDARSLCHNVIVPFERDYLQSALGGSNEPFLNKPARFTHLSENNAVRRGDDKKTLLTLISIFNEITTKSEAKQYLTYALEVLTARILDLNLLNNYTIKYDPTLVDIYNFIFFFLEKNYEGETLAIVVGALEKIYYKRLGNAYKVKAHKVNQSGASSKETGDIDIFKGDLLLYSIELKDKDFTEYDLEHAFNKILNAGGNKGEFIFGSKVIFNFNNVNEKLKEFEAKGFYPLLHDIYSYCRHTLLKIELNSKAEFIEEIFSTSIEINSKEDTKKWIQELLIKLKWTD